MENRRLATIAPPPATISSPPMPSRPFCRTALVCPVRKQITPQASKAPASPSDRGRLSRPTKRRSNAATPCPCRISTTSPARARSRPIQVGPGWISSLFREDTWASRSAWTSVTRFCSRARSPSSLRSRRRLSRMASMAARVGAPWLSRSFCRRDMRKRACFSASLACSAKVLAIAAS